MRRNLSRLVVVALTAFGLPVLPAVMGEDIASASNHQGVFSLGPMSLVSASATGQPGDVMSRDPSISHTGRYVAFDSMATNLTPESNGPSPGVFLRDRQAPQTTQISRDASQPSVSPDERYVAFSTRRALVPSDARLCDVGGQFFNCQDIYIRDIAAGTFSRISLHTSGTEANGDSYAPAMAKLSLAFYSKASNLVDGDTEGFDDVFVRDLGTGATSRVSVTQSGTGGNGHSFNPAITPDGRFVAFQSDASNLVSGDTNGVTDVFVRDLAGATTTRISISSGGAQGTRGSYRPAISADGRYVVFDSNASLAEGSIPSTCGMFPTRPCQQIYMHDRVTGTTTRISSRSDGSPGDGDSYNPSVSASGRFIAFHSYANIVLPNLNFKSDIYAYDVARKVLIRVTDAANGAEGNGNSFWARISGDGRFVTFWSDATNLVSPPSNGQEQIFVRQIGPGGPSAVPAGQAVGCGAAALYVRNPSFCLSDPVNSATGSFFKTVTDVTLPGIGLPFEFTRAYTSSSQVSGPLGPGWTHTYAASLVVDPDRALVRTESGQEVIFARQPDGSFVAPPGGTSTLTSAGAAYDLLRQDQARLRFDASGRLTQARDRNGQGVTVAYGSNGLISTVTDASGRVVTFTHDGAGLLNRISLPDGRSVAFAYISGRLTSVTDLRGKVWTYAYDAAGRLTQFVNPNGHAVVTNAYGTDGRVVEQRDARGNPSTFSWDAVNQTAAMTDARGGVWKDVYFQNVLLRRIDPLGNATEYEYDQNLNLARFTDARGNVTSMEYEAAGNLVRHVSPIPLSYERTFAYDGQGNLMSMTDGRGNTTTFSYDAASNVVSINRAGGAQLAVGRDPAGTGLVKKVTDERGKTTALEHDPYGNLTSVTFPSGSVATMTRDAAGRITALTDPRAYIPGATPSDYRWTYIYDDAGGLTSQTDPLGRTTSWARDDAGNVVSRTDALNRVTSYGYDQDNHLTSVTAPDGGRTSYAYDAAGNLVSRTDANLHTTAYSYDAASRLQSLTSPLGKVWSYEFDANSNVTKSTDPRGAVANYLYDELNRLTEISYTGGAAAPTVLYGYDANGNRTSMADGAGSESTLTTPATARPPSRGDRASSPTITTPRTT